MGYLASICILHLYAKYVKEFCMLSAHNMLTVKLLENHKNYSATEMLYLSALYVGSKICRERKLG